MSWLSRWRLTVYSQIIVAVYLGAYAYVDLRGVLQGQGLLDMMGKPVGTDFLEFWTAASLALAGKPTAAYSLAKMQALHQTVIGALLPPIPWFYPPTFLLLMLPLAFLPYLAALFAWLSITLTAYLLVVWRIAPDRTALWLTLAFPGTYQNFIHSQNGFLSATLLGAGLLWVDKLPIVGGLLLGLLSYKPHLALLIPVALIAGRRWKALAAAAASASGLALASWLVFGLDTWKAFWLNLPLAGKLIEMGMAPLTKMPTVFIGTLLAGAGFPAAYVLQGLTTLAAMVAVAWVWSRETPLPWRASALALGALLATPYAFEYDLAILALPLAWLGWQGYTKGWRSGEQSLLFLGWLMPMAAPLLAAKTRLQIGPLILMALMFLIFRRTRQVEAVEPC
jgi:hypothetical protein